MARVLCGKLRSFGLHFPACSLCGPNCFIEGHIHSKNHFWKLWEKLQASLEYNDEDFIQDFPVQNGQKTIRFNHVRLSVHLIITKPPSPPPPQPPPPPPPPPTQEQLQLGCAPDPWHVNGDPSQHARSKRAPSQQRVRFDMQCETEVVQVRDCAYRDCRLNNACTRPPLQENQLLVHNALPLPSHPMPAGFMPAVEAEAPASPSSSSASFSSVTCSLQQQWILSLPEVIQCSQSRTVNCIPGTSWMLRAIL